MTLGVLDESLIPPTEIVHHPGLPGSGELRKIAFVLHVVLVAIDHEELVHREWELTTRVPHLLHPRGDQVGLVGVDVSDGVQELGPTGIEEPLHADPIRSTDVVLR